MNTTRAITSGLLAGLVLNIGEAALHAGVYGEASEQAIKALGGDLSGAATGTAQLVLITFVQGLIAMLLYAAVQPTWKPGVATAVRIGLMVWVLSGVYSAIYIGAGLAGLLPASLTWGPVAFELVLYPLAVIVGSRVYRPL